MLRWKRDLICGIAVLVFCVFGFVHARGLSPGIIAFTAAQPAPYLRMWLTLLTILGAALVIQAIRNRKDTTVKEKMFLGTTITTLGAVLGFLLLIPHLGFLLSTILFLLFTVTSYSISAWIGEGREQLTRKQLHKKIATVVGVSVIGGIAIEQLFRNVLNVWLPTFSLF